MTYEVIEIIEEWLKDEGFDGLCHILTECGCEIGDIAPCDNINLKECRAGYKVKDGISEEKPNTPE